MFVELHILQNFAPSNLNRDDTGSPKDCEFGGYRRARISSQCLKRAIRTCFRDQKLLPEHQLAVRTKRLVDAMVGRIEPKGHDPLQARQVVESALKGIGLGIKESKTEYLLFLADSEIQRAADVCLESWDILNQLPDLDPQSKGKDAKKAGKNALPSEIRKALESVMDGGKAVDLALFGRMLADRPEKNVDAACQVAHAISTNRVSVEFDFYTAVDDLKSNDTSGADMLGTVEFNSACYYRYANIDLNQLSTNLGDDTELAIASLKAFLQASFAAVPTGKQNSAAAQNPPSFVMAVIRDTGLWSLANAFLQPVRPEAGFDLMQSSIRALDRYWGQLNAMYGDGGIRDFCHTSLHPDAVTNLAACGEKSVADLTKRVLDAVQSAQLVK